ncbi:MAG: carboxymuconolactone decarboxylase family protein [Deltaproteobacteria bacterium]|nr:carboxymuconolactone decarboxylase family protein [Deltaproteobacteria bacterium]
MSRIQPNQTPDTKSQELLVGVKKMLGATPNMFTTMAHSSATLGVFVGALGALSGSKLTGALREQIALTVAGTNGCDYCASAHTALGKMNKLEESELTRNLDSNSTDPKTQAALSFARKIVEARGRVSDADLQLVRSFGYSEGEIVDMVTVTCINIFTNYFNHIADTEIDFPLVRTQSTAKIA